MKRAVRQIQEKDYGLMFANEVRSGKRLVKVGVVFSRRKRNIVKWQIVSAE